MKYEDLVKMSVKELKDRLKDLNTQAQAAAGKDLDALLEEATTITGILDDVKNREKLAGIAKDAEGGAEPTGGEKGEEVKDKAREERGQNIKDGKAVKFSAKKTFGVKNALSVSQTVTPTHSAADVKETFKRVAKYLSEGGLFIFDVNTIYKHREVLCDNCFVFDTDEVFCSWQNELDKETDIVNITLDFFIPAENGLYFRETEEFSERAYRDEDLTQWLSEAGLKILAIYDDMSFDEPKPESERKIFVAVNN